MFKWRLNLKLPKTFKKITTPHLLKKKVDPANLDNFDNDVKQAAADSLDDETGSSMISCNDIMQAVYEES